MSNRFFIMITMSALVFSSCFDTALLVAGIKTPEEYTLRSESDKNMDALDGSGILARFSNIQDIAVDSQDNVYVADLYAKDKKRLGLSLRKIFSDGSVTTLNESNSSTKYSQGDSERLLKDSDVFGMVTMALNQDVLYFSGNNCIRSVDISQPVENLKVQIYWGTCFPGSPEQLQQYNQRGMCFPESPEKPQQCNQDQNFFRELIDFKSHLVMTRDHTIYAIAKSESEGNFVFKLSPNQTKAEKSTFNGSLAKTFGFSHDHRVFIGYFDPPQGPPPMGDGKTYTEISGSKGYSKVDYFFSHMVFDSQNRLYAYDDSDIVRYDSDWKSKWIGRLHNYGPIKRMVLNPSETAVYLASETAVYRLPLPKD